MWGDDDDYDCYWDDYWCQWEQEDNFRDCDYTWDDDYTCWDEMSMATGCSQELVCDFYECVEDHTYHDGVSDCWEELCYSECGQYECNEWNWNYEREDWDVDMCPEDDWEVLEATGTRLGRIFMAFEDTLETAFQEFCAEGHCIDGLVDEVAMSIPEDEINTAQLDEASMALQDESVNRIVNEALDDMSQLVDLDTGKIGYLVNNATSDDIAYGAQQEVENVVGDGWLAGLIGGFVDGLFNSGMERRGERDEEECEGDSWDCENWDGQTWEGEDWDGQTWEGEDWDSGDWDNADDWDNDW